MESFPRFSDWLENEGQAPDYAFDTFLRKAGEDSNKLHTFVAKSQKEEEKLEKKAEKKKKQQDAKKPVPPPQFDEPEEEEPSKENNDAFEQLKKIAKERAEKAKKEK